MQAWEQFLTELEHELGSTVVNKWLRPLKVARFDAGNLYLEAQDSFQILWFEEHIRKRILTTFVNNNHNPIKVHLSVTGELEPTKKKSKTKVKKGTSEETVSPPFQLSFGQLDPFLILKNFIANDTNLLAFKLFCEITVYDPETQQHFSSHPKLGAFNPIYLHGSSGSGKTHLLMATTHALRQHGLKALYIDVGTFTDHFVTAIRAGEMSLLRKTYRNVDVLILDDIHLLSRKVATQEELFHTFNTLHLSGKQIILSANCPPLELQHIEARLISRFEWGIVLSLEPIGSDEELKQLLNQKTQALQFHLQQKIEEFLLETFKSSPKALIRALEALILRLHLQQRQGQTIVASSLAVATARTLLADLINEEEKQAVTQEKIIQVVAEHYGIRSEDICSKIQTRDCALPRQIVMYLCRTKLRLPFMTIGDIMARDHSTVMTSVKQIQKSIDEGDREILGSLAAIKKSLTRTTLSTDSSSDF